MADNRKDVELRITGRDDSQGATRSAAQGVDKITAALSKQADQSRKTADASAQLYNRLSDQLREAQQAAVDSRQKFEDLRTAMAGNAEPTRAQVKQLNDLEKAANSADQRVASLSSSLTKADESFRTNVNASRQAAEAAGYVQDVTKAVEAAEAAQQRAARLTAFRDLGTQAAASAGSLDEFARATKTADTASDGLARSLLSILDPSQSAKTTLAGLVGEVERVVAAVGEADKPIREYQDAINDLGRIQSSLLRQAGAVDQYRQQAAAVEASQAAFNKAKADVLQYAAAVERAEEPNRDLANSLHEAEMALKNAAGDLDAQKAKLTALKRPLDEAKISTHNLAEAETQLRKAAGDTAGAVAKLDKAMSGQNSRAGRFLGLRPYEIQNLGFQLNDVFTQLASGASVTQTFSQQAGQILQIFPGIFSKIIAFSPALLAIGLAAGTAIAAIKRVLDQTAAVRNFTGLLALNADGARYSAQALAQTADDLDRFGASAANAQAELRTFMSAGIDASQLKEFGITAQNVADITGRELPDAASLLATSFSGGYDEVKKLDDEFNFLTAAEREHIQAMFDSGEAAEARRLAFERFSEVAQDAADKSRGPWTEATRSLDGSWKNFLDTVSRTEPIQNAIGALNGLINTAAKALAWLGRVDEAQRNQNDTNKAQTRTTRGFGIQAGGLGIPLGGGLSLGFGRTGTEVVTPTLREMQEFARGGANSRAPGVAPAGQSERDRKIVADMTRSYQEQAAAQKQLSDAERVRVAGLKAVREAEERGAKSASALAEVRAAAEKNEQFKVDQENAKKAAASQRKADAASRRAAAQERAAEAKRQAAENALLSDQRNIDSQLARQQKSDIDAQLKQIESQYNKVYADIAKARAAGVKTIGEDNISLDAFQKQVDQAKALAEQFARQKNFEDQIKLLEDQRSARLDEIAQKVASGEITSADALREANGVQSELGPKITQMAEDAITFAQAIAGAHPSPEIEKFIADMRATLREQNGAGTKGPLAGFATAQLTASERDLNAIIEQRNALVQGTNALLDAGAIRQQDAQARIRDAYASAQPLIAQQTAGMRETLELLMRQGQITQQVYAAWSQKLDLISIQSEYVDENFTKLRTTIEQSIEQGAVTAFDSLSETIGQAIDGTISWGEAITSLGNVARQFIADFLKGIADVLVQIAVMQAIKNLPFLNGLTQNIMDFTGLAAGATALGVAGGTVTAGALALQTSSVALDFSGSTLITAAANLQAAAFALAAANSASLFHAGGVVGDLGSRMSRKIPAAAFWGAPRYHNGSLGIGLRHNEQAAILKKNEEVLTEDNPRHIRNWNKGGGQAAPAAQGDVRIINTFDPSEFVSRGLGGREGERAIVNFMRANKSAVKSALGIG